MSTILKALKKLEEDQRAAAPANLAGKIVSTETGPGRRPPHAVLIGAGVAGGLLLALLVVGGWLWWRQPPSATDQALSATALPAVSPQPVAAREPEPPASLVAAPPPPGVAQPPPPLSPAPAPSAVSKAAVSPPVPAAANSDKPAVVPKPLAVGEPPRETAPQQVTLTDRQIPPPGQRWAAPQLEVTDIFPPAAGQSRMAVVNGLPVMAGMMVEDALVEEIRADQVLFNIGGKTVTVPLNQGR